MSSLMTRKLRQLSETVADLNFRVREALAGELSKAISGAVGEVVSVLVSGRPTRPAVDPYRSSAQDRWDGDDDQWNDRRDRWRDEEPTYSPTTVRSADPPPSASPTLRTAVSAGVHVSRWWIARKGTLLVATGAGFAVGLIGLFGGTAAKIAVALIAATAELLSVTDVLGTGAAHLTDF